MLRSVHAPLFADIAGKFAASSWGKKIAKQAAKKNLNDFDRFKVMVARVKKSSILKREIAKVKKTTK